MGAALALLVSAGSGLSIFTIRRVESKIQKLCTGSECTAGELRRGGLPSVVGPCYRKACVYLILGSDTRAGLSKQQQSQFGRASAGGGQRADTIIVVQVDTAKNRTVVLSIPRDLRVPIPGHGEGKINTAFELGGANLMVRTVANLTGLRINHYVQVNFAGFERLVDAIGGVPICINKPLQDKLAGLNLPHKGCYTLRGSQALAFVRARHIQGDLIPDFSRISRQQQFLQALVHKALSAGAVFDIPALIRAAQKNLVLDDKLNLYSLQDLTRKLGALGQAGVQFRVVPAFPITVDGVDYVRLLQPQAGTLFERIRDGKSLGTIGKAAYATPLSPAEVSVRVLDASSNGQAARVASFLARAGFRVEPVEVAPPELTTTVLLYGHGESKPKQAVASFLTDVPLRFDATYTAGADVTLVIGPDFQGIAP